MTHGKSSAELLRRELLFIADAFVALVLHKLVVLWQLWACSHLRTNRVLVRDARILVRLHEIGPYWLFKRPL